MSQNIREDAYRAALGAADAELNEILAQFEQLRLRKECMERAVEALKPVLGGSRLEAVPTQQVAYSPSNLEANAAHPTHAIQRFEAPPQDSPQNAGEPFPAHPANGVDSWGHLFHKPARTATGH